MIKVTAFFGCLLFCMMLAFTSGAGRYPGGAKVEWKKTADMASLQQSESRPVVIDVYTDWCYYCKVMDNTTWRHDSVVNYLKQNFYTIKMNAEDKNELEWNGKQYTYHTRYKVNMLAVELLKGNMVYPSTVIIPAKGDWLVIPGARKPSEIELALKYYGTRSNETMEFDDFRSKFSGQWK